MSTTSTTPNFTKLNATNYPTWEGDMSAWLRSHGQWRIVSGQKLCPILSATPTAAELTAVESWEDKAEKAAGNIYLMVEPDQKIHFKGIKDKPVEMWKALETVHLQKRPGTRFNAYDDLFSIRKEEEESLQTLMNRVDLALTRITDLRPASFTIDQLDSELASMALIRALPEEYSHFTSSLLLLDKLDKATIQQAFVTEDTQRRRRAADASASTMAMTASLAKAICDFCGKPGHDMAKCFAFQKAQKNAKENAQKPRQKKRTEQANSAKDKEESTEEFAGNASTRLSDHSDLPTQNASTRLSDHSDLPMLTLIGLQTQAPLLT